MKWKSKYLCILFVSLVLSFQAACNTSENTSNSNYSENPKKTVINTPTEALTSSPLQNKQVHH